MKFLTSFSTEGYKLYGKHFLESWFSYSNLPITVYYENEKPDIENHYINYKDLLSLAEVANYLQNISKFSVFHGQINNKRYYKYDWFKFCRKCFAQIDFAQANEGVMWWIDADVKLISEVQVSWFEKWFESNIFMSYLGRPDQHSCASLVGWNLDHPVSSDFFAKYEDLIKTGNIFLLPEWHDSFVLDYLRTTLAIPSVDMAANLPRKELKGYANVFDKTVPFARHYKGQRKHYL